MLKKLLNKNPEGQLKKHKHTLNLIKDNISRFENISDSDLKKLRDKFTERYMEGTPLEDLIPEAFAAVFIAIKRTLNISLYDEQLIGGLLIFKGTVIEMKTGEGKTFIAPLASYLQSISRKQTHVVTVNEYLAHRDASLLAPAYVSLGLSVGVSLNMLTTEQKIQAYSTDVVYVTNSELGFDFLKDRLAKAKDLIMQKEHSFAIVDEADLVFIDEARTPVVLTGAKNADKRLYLLVKELTSEMEPTPDGEGFGGHFDIDIDAKEVYLTPEGIAYAEAWLERKGMLAENDTLYSGKNIQILTHLIVMLRGCYAYHKDIDYLVNGDVIEIIDTNTGRVQPNRRWGEGLHQSIEAKEGVSLKPESIILNQITYQNLFSKYEKLSGMTGTAMTDTEEFQDIYGLPVIELPTHHKMIREDLPDMIFRTQTEKFKTIAVTVRNLKKEGRPVLIGTDTVATSEILSSFLEKEGIEHSVLNAKQNTDEANIISDAGLPGRVTIATNMAGRGTDIVLGGTPPKNIGEHSEDEANALISEWQSRHDSVVKAGGLHVIGAQRHDSRRIDNQLRGRCGRQGDPGSSQFFLSLEDPLISLFAPDRLERLMQGLEIQEGESLNHPFVSKAVEMAQDKVRDHRHGQRKDLLAMDKVLAEQRDVIYKNREILLSMDVDFVSSMIDDVFIAAADFLVDKHATEIFHKNDLSGLQEDLTKAFYVYEETPESVDFKQTPAYLDQWVESHTLMKENEDNFLDELSQYLAELLHENYRLRSEEIEDSIRLAAEAKALLSFMDLYWTDHLNNVISISDGMYLRAYAQKDPAQEYKREAFEMFIDMVMRRSSATASYLLRYPIPGEGALIK